MFTGNLRNQSTGYALALFGFQHTSPTMNIGVRNKVKAALDEKMRRLMMSNNLISSDRAVRAQATAARNSLQARMRQLGR